MEFSLIAGWIAGLIATIAMTAMMQASKKAGMTNMPGMPLIQGAMMSDDPATAKKIGMFTHVVVMGTFVFGSLYAAIFATLGSSSWIAGIVIGLIHGLIAGGVAMPMMGNVHPRMEGAAAFTGDTTWEADGQDLRIAAPGFFGRNYGGMTPMGIVMGHVIFGLVLALTYTLLL